MSTYEIDAEAYEATEMFRQMRAVSEATVEYLAGYYGYLAGTAAFPPYRKNDSQGFAPVDFDEATNGGDPELSRALRLSDWFSLGMVAARREQGGENLIAYVPTVETMRAGRHTWYRDIDAGDKAPSGSRILH